MAAIQNVTKAGDLVSVTNSQDIQVEINGTQARLKKEVSFEVALGETPTLSNIRGRRGPQGLWIGHSQHSVETGPRKKNR